MQSSSSSCSSSSTDDSENLSMYCPISKELMQDAVIAADNYSYSEDAIREWFRGQREKGFVIRSPMTGEPLANEVLRPNFSLRSMIAETVVKLESSRLKNEKKAGNDANSLVNRNSLFAINKNPAMEKIQENLISACEKGDLSTVRKLVDMHADLSLADKSTKFPLSAAIWSLNLPLIKFICNTINPTPEYVELCINRNLEIYGSLMPIFKKSSKLTLEDLCDGYLDKEGRSVLSSPWIWEQLERNKECWESIILHDDNSAIAKTRGGSNWNFGPSNTTVQACTKQDPGRSIVWAMLINQIAHCAELKVEVGEYVKEVLKVNQSSSVPVNKFSPCG